eukprot:8459481-Alexandrium_andersonii.AAC.1
MPRGFRAMQEGKPDLAMTGLQWSAVLSGGADHSSAPRIPCGPRPLAALTRARISGTAGASEGASNSAAQGRVPGR